MSETIYVKKDDLLFNQGDTSDCMYIVTSGQFKIFLVEGAEELERTLAGPGNLIGEMSLFDKKIRTASARATTTSAVLKLPYKQLEKDLETVPDWIKITLKTLSTKLRDANRKLLG